LDVVRRVLLSLVVVRRAFGMFYSRMLQDLNSVDL
jgi:hypothetical protein